MPLLPGCPCIGRSARLLEKHNVIEMETQVKEQKSTAK
jgi:hypothetical protein